MWKMPDLDPLVARYSYPVVKTVVHLGEVDKYYQTMMRGAVVVVKTDFGDAAIGRVFELQVENPLSRESEVVVATLYMGAHGPFVYSVGNLAAAGKLALRVVDSAFRLEMADPKANTEV